MLRKSKVILMDARNPKQGMATGETVEAGSLAPEAAGHEAAVEAVVLRALERKPALQPPVDFAGRVAVLAASQPHLQKGRSFGLARMVASAAAVLVALALFALASRAQASFANLAFDLELVVLVQLAFLGWWLGARRDWTR